MAEDLKICKECKHCKFMLTQLGAVCLNPGVSTKHINLVSGRISFTYQYCLNERGSDYGQCARSGNLFERK